MCRVRGRRGQKMMGKCKTHTREARHLDVVRVVAAAAAVRNSSEWDRAGACSVRSGGEHPSNKIPGGQLLASSSPDAIGARGAWSHEWVRRWSGISHVTSFQDCTTPSSEKKIGRERTKYGQVSQRLLLRERAHHSDSRHPRPSAARERQGTARQIWFERLGAGQLAPGLSGRVPRRDTN